MSPVVVYVLVKKAKGCDEGVGGERGRRRLSTHYVTSHPITNEKKTNTKKVNRRTPLGRVQLSLV
jgi:hypothetical protein